MGSLLITFSGLDGAGKSTQIAHLVGRLEAKGERPAIIWTRGGYTPVFEALKKLLRRTSRGRVVPPAGHSPQREQALSRPFIRRLWLTLAILDLIWVYGVQVRWRHLRGLTVICDRYLWDTLLDFRLNFPQEQVERWWLWRILQCVSPKPDVAFALLIPVGESLRRSQQKNEPFPDPPEVLDRRLAAYEELEKRAGWHVMDGCRPLDELADEIWEIVQTAMNSTSS